MQEVWFRWAAAFFAAAIIASLDHRESGVEKVVMLFVRTILFSILLDALRRAF